MPTPAPVAVALDAPDLDTAANWAALVTPYVSTVKIGLELYLRYGPDVVATVRGASGVDVFLDLKLHDIPNTVAGAARAVSRLRPEIITVHAAGGSGHDQGGGGVRPGRDGGRGDPAHLDRGGRPGRAGGARDGQRRGPPDGGRSPSPRAPAASSAPRRRSPRSAPRSARTSCSSPRASARPGADSDDQARIATPEEAIKAGADLLVIGAPDHQGGRPGRRRRRDRHLAAPRGGRPERPGGPQPVGRVAGRARATWPERHSGGVAIGHTGIKRCPVTGDVFGVTILTCGDSLDLHCDRGAAVGKMSIQDKASVEHPRI